MLISGLNKTTLLDYPGRVAATVFTGGCNFRCPFCHNGGLVLCPLTQEHYTEEDILGFLKKRKSILSGVCITGGEPTIQQDLPDFIKQIKELGLTVKLDTNGSHPHMLEELIAKRQIDYVAMDIKNAPGKYQETTGLMGENTIAEASGNAFPVKAVQQSVELLKNSDIPYEFRTTVVKEFHVLEDLQEICMWIAGSPAYYLQQFEDSGQLIAEMDGVVEKGMIFHAYEEAEIKRMAEQLNRIPGMEGKVHMRGLSGV